ncbi:hypothetical protein KBC04_04845 [Candidatus Babeliales bacterium]|nr:hypothetical protein [Candidatus Babeliales bacterium]MBP6870184.1 hypothetical protein [Candidatus Babeliales bacterium]MBP9844340.1 hypothetical protein [Candidatus Babeliales bacterium]MBP9844344.1 hypothetical protein [Candidatus Babeliales bacterium]
MLQRLGIILLLSGTVVLPSVGEKRRRMDPPTPETTIKTIRKFDAVRQGQQDFNSRLDLFMASIIGGENFTFTYFDEQFIRQVLTTKRPGFLVRPATVLSVALCSRNIEVSESIISLAAKSGVELDLRHSVSCFNALVEHEINNRENYSPDNQRIDYLHYRLLRESIRLQKNRRQK